MTAGAALGAICTALLQNLASGPAGSPATVSGAMVMGEAPAPDGAAAGGEPADGLTPDRLARHAEASERVPAGGAEAAMPGRAVLDRDPRLADAALASTAALAPTAVGAAADARAEAALDLSRRERRELQRRLALAEHDPRFVDGIFGPATRAAIAGWQTAAGLPPTGYLDAGAVALLERQTDDRYRAWKAEQDADRRRQRTQVAAATSPVPPVTPASAGKCHRGWKREIAYGQNVLCDLRGLRENVGQLFRVSQRS
jgi:hypothetical protein